MHHLIQHGKVRTQLINVPEGFPELLSDITREVLRCQPTTECLCQFIIDYLHSVVATRDKARIAKSIIDRALRTVDEIIADMCICNITKTKADQMCEVMEECFRRFLAQRRCEKFKQKEIIKFNEFDMLDELIQKCKFSDEELKNSRPAIEAAYQKFADAYTTAQQNTEGTESLYQYFREREMKRLEERLRAEAAIKIQANFRGFLVRKSMFMDKSLLAQSPVHSETEVDLLEKELAARKIQHFYRHHMISVKAQINDTEQRLQVFSTPASRVSLTALPADHLESDQNISQDNEDKIDKDIQEEPHDNEKSQNGHYYDVSEVEEVTSDVEEANDETYSHEETAVE